MLVLGYTRSVTNVSAQAAIKDLTHTTDKKAEIVELLATRDDVQNQLQELHEKIRILAEVLGEPKVCLYCYSLDICICVFIMIQY